LLDNEFQRLSGRQNPGAGRPTKLYRRSGRELSVTLPERRYATWPRTPGQPRRTPLADFRAHLGDRTSPPGPKDTWIGEIVIHGADIRGPLGIRQQTPIPTVRRVADFYRGSNLIVGAKNRIAGLTLRDRHRLGPRHRSRGHRPAAAAGPGHDRPATRPDRPDR